MNHRSLPLVLAVSLLVGAGAIIAFRPLPPPIDRASFDRIKVGMPKREVEAILGGPPGNYTTKTVISSPRRGVLSEPGNKQSWLGNEGMVLVRFDDRGAVTWKRFVDVAVFEETFLERLTWMLERLLP
jgi:hypothetical protein